MSHATLCLWYDKTAEEAAHFYAKTFPNSQVGAVHRTPGDSAGMPGDVLTVDFTVLGLPCIGLNGGPAFAPSEAFSFQIATTDQEETDRYWDAIVDEWRERKSVRLVQGQVGSVLANHSKGPH